MVLIILAGFSTASAARAEPADTGLDCNRSGCHAESGAAEFVHQLVGAGDCASCHLNEANGGASHPSVVGEPAIDEISLAASRECRPCHGDQHEQAAEETPHGLCVECHDPHAGDSASLLRGGQAQLCLSCHAEAFEPSRLRMRYSDDDDAEVGRLDTEIRQHAGVAEGRCDECHLMHSGSSKDLLRGAYPAADYASYDRSTYSSCLESCHSADLVEEQPTTTTTRFRNGDDNLHFRHVASRPRGRSCRLCHAPHQARGPGLVRSAMPYGEERLTLEFSAGETGGRCATSCHLTVEYDRAVAIPSRMRVLEPEKIP